MTNRNQMRKEILAKRKNLDESFQAEASQKICDHIFSLNIFKEAKHVAIYFANNGEVNPKKILSAEKKFYLPILDPKKPNHLLFQSYNNDEILKPNQYGIPEPSLNVNKLIEPEKLDCVLVPLVAFDNEGNRLGMGVGYYDRTFSFLQHKTRPHKPVLIGLAYSFQKIPTYTPENWDIPLDIIVTDHEVLTLKNSGN